jgi:hypothetical protein
MAVFLFAGKHGFREAEIIKRALLYFYAMLRFQTKNDRDNFADYLVRQGATQTRDGTGSMADGSGSASFR